MHFNSDDLKQLTPEYLDKLPKERIIEITQQMRNDLTKAQDRLNQNPCNSSKPSGACAPWEKPRDSSKNSSDNADHSDDNEKNKDDNSDDTPQGKQEESQGKKVKKKRKPGKQKGAKGFGRTQKLEVTEKIVHRFCTCKGCNAALDEKLPFTATGGHYTIDLKRPKEGKIGLQGVYIKHIYGIVTCTCGFDNKTSPNKVESEEGWKVDLGECRLAGPMLLAFMVFLKMRMHMSTRKIRELLQIWIGISLSTGCINTAIREAGRSVYYLDSELLELLKSSGLLHVDETSWKEHKVLRWMWVGVGEDVTYFVNGARSKKTVEKILDGFTGWLMSDGYCVYRKHDKRLRCWAHLKRKAQGLKESWNKTAATFGTYAVKTFKALMDSVYKMREMSESERKAEQVSCNEEKNTFIEECKKHKDTEHEKTSAFAREVLNDTEAIFTVLNHPEEPLTNNAAERALRPLVIMRKICQGSKTEEGSRTVAILASIIETLKRRKQDVWGFLADVINKRRLGALDPPPLPNSS